MLRHQPHRMQDRFRGRWCVKALPEREVARANGVPLLLPPPLRGRVGVGDGKVFRRNLAAVGCNQGAAWGRVVVRSKPFNIGGSVTTVPVPTPLSGPRLKLAAV